MGSDSGQKVPTATTTQDDDDARGGEDATAEEPAVRPGAFRAYPSNREPSPERSATATATANQPPIDAESQNVVVGQSDQVVVEAYAVEDPEDPQSAIVVDTCFGVERKRLFLIVSISAGTVAIVLGIVLGILAPRSKENDASQQMCGPLCGSNTAVPFPNRELFTKTCESWDFTSKEDYATCNDDMNAVLAGKDVNVKVAVSEKDKDVKAALKAATEKGKDAAGAFSYEEAKAAASQQGVIFPEDKEAAVLQNGKYADGAFTYEDIKAAVSLRDMYAAAASGCGCPDVEPPQNGCGKLCLDPSELLPDPQLVVKDINNDEFSCQDWQLKSMFDTNPQECVNYNAIGVLCGCKSNEMHPDACGGICSTGEDYFHTHGHIWDTACASWDTFSRYLPIWYNNDGDETCEEYYSDVAHGCACPVLSDVEPECGTLCQQRRTCDPICQAGKVQVPDPDLLVRRESCQAWELHSRLEVHEFVCPFYNMVGAQCGCEENEPAPDACGPLCGGASLPDPDKEVYGQTCESWNFMSTYLSPAYGSEPTDNLNIKSCEEHFLGIAYACGCPDIEPPTEGCGTLCGDGQALPLPTKTVNARTCQDLELMSLFEKDAKQCTRYEIFGTLCGCPRSDVYEEDCFKLEHLQNETYYFEAGGSVYSVSFGDDGYFAQIQSNGDLFVIGVFNGFDNSTVAMYGGGAPCSKHGPRSGSVSIVEDVVTSPEIMYVIEPSVCVYQAELKVPKFCATVGQDQD